MCNIKDLKWKAYKSGECVAAFDSVKITEYDMYGEKKATARKKPEVKKAKNPADKPSAPVMK